MSKTAKATKNKKTTASTNSSKSALVDFFIEELRDIYWAEKHLTKALPKMKKAATYEELANAFNDHLVQTEEHVSRLEEVFEMMGVAARAKKCEAMEGLVKEAEEIIEETEEGSATRDVALIMAAQKVEHYEIATYGGLIQLARTISRDDVAKILKQTIAEEKETDELLSGLAENNINASANTEDSD